MTVRESHSSLTYVIMQELHLIVQTQCLYKNATNEYSSSPSVELSRRGLTKNAECADKGRTLMLIHRARRCMLFAIFFFLGCTF